MVNYLGKGLPVGPYSVGTNKSSEPGTPVGICPLFHGPLPIALYKDTSFTNFFILCHLLL